MSNPMSSSEINKPYGLGEVVISNDKYIAKAAIGISSSSIWIEKGKTRYDISFNLNVNYNPEDKKSFKFNIGFTGSFSRDNLIELLPQIKPAVKKYNKEYSMGCLPEAIAYVESLLAPKEDNLEKKL